MALAATFAFGVPVFVDRRDYTVAVSNWVKNPTLENGAAVARESIKSRRIALISHLAAGAILFVLISVGWSLFARRSAKPGNSSTDLPAQ
jgi:hypothetical protein